MEYKFRGKRKDNGEWVVGDLWRNLTNPDKPLYKISYWVIEDGVNTNYEVEVIPETVGMWTGRKDKDGKLLFAGDIVDKGRGEIYWDEQHCQFRVRWHNEVFKKVRGGLGEMLFANSEIVWSVIGNVTDNPELLNPLAESPAFNTMNNFDPGTKAEEVKEVPAGEALESAAQDQAMGVNDSEEGAEAAEG